MRRGEIGTDAKQRVIFVWEGAVASLPDHRSVQAMEWLACRTGQHSQALKYWKVSGKSLGFMWTLFSRTFFRIDVCVTSRGAGFTKALSKKITQENWPVEYVYHAETNTLGRSLAHSPDVWRVYYGLEGQRWAFGPQGYFISPDTPLTLE